MLEGTLMGPPRNLMELSPMKGMIWFCMNGMERLWCKQWKNSRVEGYHIVKHLQSMIFPKVPSMIMLLERYGLDVDLGLSQY